MRFRLPFCLSLFVITIFTLFISCSKKEQFVSDALSDYIPLQTGKYITYRLDSMVFTNFGRNTEIHSYQVQHVVDAEVTDNIGRPSWRIYSYIRDSAGTQLWTPNGSYFITPLPTQTEVTEDNLRVIKMHLPIKEGYTWKGNSYLPDEPYAAMYDFNNDNDMKNWDFTYDVFEPALSYKGNNYADVYTVIEQDDSFNVPIVDVNKYGYKTVSVEKYSKTIGMIYRQYELWEYQPNTSGPSPYKTGFGVTMWMIDHN
jgi:hypothetical protein